MKAVADNELDTSVMAERKRPAYDPNSLSPEDEEARKYDDNSEGIDWDEIIATTQDDVEAGRFSFNSADYATEAEADAALRSWLDSILDEVLRDTLPYLHSTPRVSRDIARCLDFVARQPWGRASEREMDIYRTIGKIRLRPKLNRVGARRPSVGIELRRCNAAQFAIIYAYVGPSTGFPHGLVSIRAVRHSRVKNVFSGVGEPIAPCSGA